MIAAVCDSSSSDATYLLALDAQSNTAKAAKSTDESQSGGKQSAAAQTDKADKVTISSAAQTKASAAAQAKSLKSQGQTVKQIATSLGCTTKQVEEYLGESSDSSGSSSSGGNPQYSASQVEQLLNML